MFESVKELIHKVLAELEALEVKAQQGTSVAVDETGPGADTLNAGEAASHEGEEQSAPPPSADPPAGA